MLKDTKVLIIIKKYKIFIYLFFILAINVSDMKNPFKITSDSFAGTYGVTQVKHL